MQAVDDNEVHPAAITEAYLLIQKIGEGTFGDVYKAIQRPYLNGAVDLRALPSNPENYVAIKKIRSINDEEGMPAIAIREVGLLRTLEHVNVVRLHRVIDTPQRLYLVFEYFERDLKRYMDQIYPDLMEHDLVKSYIFQVLRGLDYCHTRRVIHRDIKPQNLLIDSRGRIKIADFGLARAFSVPVRNYTPEVVTLWYRCPEILLGEDRYTPAVDIWSLGCLGAEMFVGSPLFPGDAGIDMLFRIFRTLGKPTNQTWNGVERLPNFPRGMRQFPRRGVEVLLNRLLPADATPITPEDFALINAMLKMSPAERISASAGMQSPAFDTLARDRL